jgi:hypothetical protein
MGRLQLTVFALLLAPSLVLAQPAKAPSESVTVTGTKSREVLQGFVQSFAAPTRVTGKLARWEDGICLVAVGLPPSFTKFIVQRVKEVATRVGAPVNGSAPCKPNIEIVFTTEPQSLLDHIRDKQSWLLGYIDNSEQGNRLATVTHPIQAWYTTATRDLIGDMHIDGTKKTGAGLEITYRCIPPIPGMCTLHLSNAQSGRVTGMRLGDGLRSDFYNVIIVADPNKLVHYEVGSLADYIAMLALAQVGSLDTCQQLPSIVNMLAAGCERMADALTDNDIAYLRGLYKAAPDQNLRTQRDEMAYQMEQDLKGH